MKTIRHIENPISDMKTTWKKTVSSMHIHSCHDYFFILFDAIFKVCRIYIIFKAGLPVLPENSSEGIWFFLEGINILYLEHSKDIFVFK